MKLKFSIFSLLVVASLVITTSSCNPIVEGPCDDLDYREGTVLLNGTEVQLLKETDLSISSDDRYIFNIAMGIDDCSGANTLLLNFDGKPGSEIFDIASSTLGQYQIINSIVGTSQPAADELVTGSLSMEEISEDVWKIEIEAVTDNIDADFDFSGEIEF